MAANGEEHHRFVPGLLDGFSRDPGYPVGRHLLFLSICIVSLILFRVPLESLAKLAFQDDRYTLNIVIPIISFGLIWIQRRAIFVEVRAQPGIGFATMFIGSALFVVAGFSSDVNDGIVLAISVLAVLVVVAGTFVLCYGAPVTRRAVFPLVFLILAIPLPVNVLQYVVLFFQRESAAMTYWLFHLTGVPVFRPEVLQFSLPHGLTIEVAEECSGIRSGLSLFVSSITASYLFLRSGWSRVLFPLMTIPVVIFKNAVRIVTLSLLAVYVDDRFLHGWVHRYGGLPFSVVGLALLVPMLLILMRAERMRRVEVE
jgi:exosortase